MPHCDVHVLLRDGPDEPPRWASFPLEFEGRSTWSDLLYRLARANAGRPVHDAPCGEGVCGACALRVDDRWVLACRTWVDSHHPGPFRLSPAWDPVVIDLVPDRAIVSSRFGAVLDDSEGPSAVRSSAPCLACGLCLAACPSVGPGREPGYLGAGPLHEALEVAGGNPRSLAPAAIGVRGIGRCRTIGTCESVCPAQLPLRSSLERIGRARLRARWRTWFGE